MKTVLFFTDDFRNYTRTKYEKVIAYINSLSNKEFLSWKYDDLKADVVDRFAPNPIVVDTIDKISLKRKGQPWAQGFSDNMSNGNSISGYIFAIRFQCSGSCDLLRYRPSSYLTGEFDLHLPTMIELGLIQVKLYTEEPDKEEFKFKEKLIRKYIEQNIDHLNSNIEGLKEAILEWFEKGYSDKKALVEAEEDFFKEVEIAIDTNTNSLLKYTPINVRQSPKAIATKKDSTSGLQIPTVSETFYKDIISVFNLFYKSVEKKPSIYQSKGEEDLRDYILPTLELRYENSSVTAETFNKKGKTDILITHTDSTVLFVAECKMWAGQSELKMALGQLFGYMTIRETKAALVIFVKNIIDFSEIFKKIDATIKENENFISVLEAYNESCISYRFRLPADKGSHVTLTVMAFNFEKIK